MTIPSNLSTISTQVASTGLGQVAGAKSQEVLDPKLVEMKPLGKALPLMDPNAPISAPPPMKPLPKAVGETTQQILVLGKEKKELKIPLFRGEGKAALEKGPGLPAELQFPTGGTNGGRVVNQSNQNIYAIYSYRDNENNKRYGMIIIPPGRAAGGAGDDLDWATTVPPRWDETSQQYVFEPNHPGYKIRDGQVLTYDTGANPSLGGNFSLITGGPETAGMMNGGRNPWIGSSHPGYPIEFRP
jgi:hypothetical protein